MMYGAGDDENPLPETVDCMQQLVAQYVSYVTSEACLVRWLLKLRLFDCFLM